MESLENGMKMLIVSSYPPRECGIATFTNDIFKAVKNVFGDSLRLEFVPYKMRIKALIILVR